jgi:hypothetical protein
MRPMTDFMNSLPIILTQFPFFLKMCNLSTPLNVQLEIEVGYFTVVTHTGKKVGNFQEDIKWLFLFHLTSVEMEGSSPWQSQFTICKSIFHATLGFTQDQDRLLSELWCLFRALLSFSHL